MSGIGSFVGSQQGSMRYLLEIDDTKAQETLNRFKNGLGIFNTGLNTSSKSLGTMAQQLTAVGLSADQAGTGVQQTGTQVGTFNGVLNTLQTELTESNAGLTQSNTQLKTLSQSFAGTQSPLRNFGTGINSADQSTLALSKDMGALSNNFKGVQGGLGETNTLMGRMGNQGQTLGQRMGGLKTKFSEIGIGVSATMSSVINLARSWRDLEDSQIQVDKANRKLSLTQEAVTKAQDRYNSAVNTFGKNSPQAKAALVDLNQAIENNRIQVNVAAEANEAHGDKMVDVWINTVPAIIGTMATVTSALTAVGAKGKHLTGILNGLKSAALLAAPAIAAIGTALAVAAAGILASAAISKWLKETNEGLQDLSDDGGKALDEFIKKIPAFGGAWSEAEKAFSKFLVDTFPQLFTEQDKAFIKNRQLEQSNDNVAKSAANVAEKQRIYDEALKRYNHTQETRQTTDDAAAEAALKKAKADLDAAKATQKLDTETRPLTGSVIDLTSGLEGVTNEANPLGMETFPTLSAESTTLAESLSNVKKELVPGTKAFTDNVVAQIVARNTARKTRESFDELRDAGQNVGKTMKDASGEVFFWSTEFNKWLPIADRAEDMTGKIKAGTEEYNMVLARFNATMKQTSFEEEMANQERRRTIDLLNGDWKSALGQGIGLVEQYADAVKRWQAFAKEFNATDLTDVFKIKGTGEADKFARGLIPDSIKKTLKADLKFEAMNRNFESGLQSYLNGIFEATNKGPDGKAGWIWDPDLKIDDKKAEDIAREIIHDIDKAFGKGGKHADPDTKALRDKLAAALEDGASDAEIMEILTGHIEDAPPIPVYVVNAPGNAGTLQNELAKAKITVPVGVAVASNRKGKFGIKDPYTGQFIGSYGTDPEDQPKKDKKPPYPTQSELYPYNTYGPPSLNNQRGFPKGTPSRFMFPEEAWNSYNPGNPYREGSNPYMPWGVNFGYTPGIPQGDMSGPDIMKQQGMWVDSNGVLRFGGRGGSGRNMMQGKDRGFVYPMSFADMKKQFDFSGGAVGATARAGQTGMFGSMTTDAATASKGVQTVFSTMFTALQGIFLGIATEWSKDMNSFPTNTATANSGVQTQFSTMFTALQGIFLGIATDWSSNMNSFIANAAAANSGVQTQFSTLFTAVTGMNLGLAKDWSATMNSFMKNASAAGNGVYKNLHAGNQKVADNSDDLAKHWSKVMNSFINNAKSAAAGVNKALSNIKDVKVSVGVTGPGAKFVGGKALGFHGMVTEPTLMLVGEAGPERVDVSPRSEMSKRGLSPQGVQMPTRGAPQNINITIDSIIMDSHVIRKFNLEVGKFMRKY